MTQNEKINELVNTRINGNRIETDTTYSNMLRSVTVADIKEFALYFFELVIQGNRKLDLINQIMRSLTGK